MGFLGHCCKIKNFVLNTGCKVKSLMLSPAPAFNFVCFNVICVFLFQLATGGENERPRQRRKHGITNQSGLKFSFACLIICVVILVVFLGIYALQITKFQYNYCLYFPFFRRYLYRVRTANHRRHSRSVWLQGKAICCHH